MTGYEIDTLRRQRNIIGHPPSAGVMIVNVLVYLMLSAWDCSSKEYHFPNSDTNPPNVYGLKKNGRYEMMRQASPSSVAW